MYLPLRKFKASYKMDSETNHNMKVVSCGPKRTMWSFQNIFNTLFIIFLILSSVGLWACLVEINKLKQSTSSLLETISLIKDMPVYNKLHDVNGVYVDMFNDIQHNKNNDKTDFETYNRDKRHVNKRAAVPISEAYDPLSPAPQKDLTEYCVTLLSQKCGSYLPGAPAVGPPGPPGPPGEQGRPGTMGHQGPPGLNGQKGQKGEKGDTGRVGEPGADGPKGPRGGFRRSFPGVNGIQGSNGRRGKRGLQGRPGRPGDDGIPGAPGQKGNKGEPGDPGGTVSMKGGNCSCDRAKGQKGERGHIGFYGYKGNKGIGIKGDKGQRGLVGFTGYKGDKGAAGQKGDKGYGMQGFPGPIGPQGMKGEKGDAGYCIASRCGDKYVRRKVTEPGVDSYTVQSETTTEMTTPTTTLPPTTTPSTVPPSIEPRSTVCRIKRIATPVYIKREQYVYGAILSDPLMPGTFWKTEGYHGQFLYKYNSMDRLKNKLVDSKYNLQINRYFGTQHAIYNNSFYYQFNGKQHVVRYDLSINDVVTAVPISDSHYNDSKYLYKDSKIYYDITADENGLWIVYGRPRPIGGESYIHVIKADPVTMKIIRKWRLPKKIGVYKNGFIACGIFYLIKDLEPDQTETEIDFAYDFYSDEQNDVKIKIKIPFGSSNMFTFYTNNPDRRKSVLMAWDNGNIIKYPLLF